MATFTKRAWTYHDDLGRTWRVGAETEYANSGKLGGAAWNGTDAPLPIGYRMRRTTLRDLTNHKSRTVPVYAPGATILTVGATLALHENGADVVYTQVNGTLISEFRPRRSAPDS